jgi:hypothetical protein
VTHWTSECNNTFGPGSCGSGGAVLSLLFPGTNGVAFNNFNGLDGTIADSPDGDNFVAGDGDPSYSAAFWQTITGLSVGGTYQLTFEQAAAQQGGTFGAATEEWQVSLGSQTQDSTLMFNPSGGFRPWNQQTMTFTATSTSEVLTFLALGRPSGLPPVSLLSDVSLVATPEPSAVFLTLSTIALLGLAAIRSQRKKRA